MFMASGAQAANETYRMIRQRFWIKTSWSLPTMAMSEMCPHVLGQRTVVFNR